MIVLALLTVSSAVAGPHTQAMLTADAKSVQPGSHFTLGVRLMMEKGWHTYWKNPGDAGLATEIAWTLPAGVTVGPVQWPLPEKYVETGDIVTYGYAGETMLLTDCAASTSLRPGTTLTITADIHWLECAETCVPGNASVKIILPVREVSPEPNESLLFARYRAFLPLSGKQSMDVRPTASYRNGIAAIEAELPGGADTSSADFYPDALNDASIGRSARSQRGQASIVSIPVTLSESKDSARVLDGVFVYRDAVGQKHGIHVSILLTGAGTGGTAQTSRSLDERSFTLPAAQDQQPLVVYLALALLGGLLLNIMPCVLPVIALKVFGLVKMAGDSPAKVRRLGWSFALGIIGSFLALALVVVLFQIAGRQVGWGFQFQEPLFIIVMCAVVFAFGLSLFGVFEIRVPARALERVGGILQKQEHRGGYAASFAEGVFATILATPCTAPFLGTALGFAFAQPAAVILVVFTAVGLGMALPYIALTSKPAWMKFLPKPGAWMETAREFMGFLMMATLLWLFYILGKEIGVEGLVWTSAFLLVIGLGCWLLGRFVTLASSRARAFTVWGIAAALIIGAFFLFVSPVLDARSTTRGERVAAGQGNTGGIPWEPYSPGRLESLLNEGKPVLVDFTAEWCLTCKVNEKTVLSSPSIIERVAALGIVPIRADWTNRDPDISRLLSQFGRSGVPLYVLFPQGDPDHPIILPEVITTSMMLEAINRAVPHVNP